MARKYRRRHRANPSRNGRHGIDKRFDSLKISIAHKFFGLCIPVDSHIDNGLARAHRIRSQRAGMTRSGNEMVLEKR